jgi:outer membrane protein assembly factor BamD
MKLKLIFFLMFAIALGSCSEYNKILKSTDRDLKYSYAKKYFEEGKYSRSVTLLEELVAFMKGTAQASTKAHQ